jgi:hypothetical protein
VEVAREKSANLLLLVLDEVSKDQLGPAAVASVFLKGGMQKSSRLVPYHSYCIARTLGQSSLIPTFLIVDSL